MADEPQDTVQVGIRVPAELRDRAEIYAAATERTLSGVIRLALTEYLDRAERLRQASA